MCSTGLNYKFYSGRLVNEELFLNVFNLTDVGHSEYIFHYSFLYFEDEEIFSVFFFSLRLFFLLIEKKEEQGSSKDILQLTKWTDSLKLCSWLDTINTRPTAQLILMGWLNLTSGNETLPGRHPYTVQTSVPLTFMVCILILLTVFGNAMVVIAVTTSRALRAPQNLFLVSLASADILVATLVMPFSLANELMGYWYFGKVWCEIHLALDVLFCTSSIVHLCAISLDRYWSVTQAIEHNLRRTPRRIKCTLLIVWILAGIISFPPLITMEKDEGKEDRPECKINDEKWYIIFSSTASFFAPCVIMIMVYVRIYQIAMKRTRAPPGERQRENGNIKETKCGLDPLQRTDGDGRMTQAGVGGEVNEEEVDEDPSSSDGNEINLCSLKKKKAMRMTKVTQGKLGEASPKSEVQPAVRVSRWTGRLHRERRFTFVLAVVMGVFVLCWFPFFFTYTLTSVCVGCVPETLFKMFFWFGYCNSSLNPVIYTIFNNDFRSSFKKILCRKDRRGLWIRVFYTVQNLFVIYIKSATFVINKRPVSFLWYVCIHVKKELKY